MPMEGRGLSSRQTQQAVRDREIGQPNNSEKCSEAADGVARESEGRSRLSLLCPVRLGLTRFGGHPESLARGAADAKNTSTVFAGVSPTDGRPRPCWT